jgi:hypothetical protein
MAKLLTVTGPPAAAATDDDLGLRGDEAAAAPRAPAEGRVPVYGKYDCPYGWVCVAEQHAHDLSPLALIDVYGLPEDDER